MVPLTIDHAAFLLSVRAPQQKHNPLAILIESINHAISEGFPAGIGVRMRLTLFDGQYGVEKQNALLGPAFEIAMVRDLKARNILCQFLIHVDQRRGVLMPGCTEKHSP